MLTPDYFAPLGALVVASEDGNLYIIPKAELERRFKFAGTLQLQEQLEEALILRGRLVNIRAAKHIIHADAGLGAEASAEEITRERP